MTDGLPLFDRATVVGPDVRQPRELKRVASRISAAILDFCRARECMYFYADELRAYVSTECGTNAPASADRILRSLRQSGRIAYVVTSRSDSRYFVERVVS